MCIERKPRTRQSQCLHLIGRAGIVFVAILAGCGKSRLADRKPVVPVRGFVSFQGKPAVGAVVSFQPAGQIQLGGLRANGRVGDDGAFALTTYVTADGAPPGQYVVTVYWADPAKRLAEDEGDERTDLAPDLLKGRFAGGRSVLRATVGDKPVELAPLDLAASDIPQSGEYRLNEK
jgi:hypothetical protein